MGLFVEKMVTPILFILQSYMVNMEKNEKVCVREEKNQKANFSINGNATIEIFKLVIILLLPVEIFFCPIINILLCLLLICVKHNKEAIYKGIKEKAIEYTEKSKNNR